MGPTMFRTAAAFAASIVISGIASAQQVTRETIPGITNFARLETTIACGGATKPEAIVELKRMGYASIITLREASEAGADIDAEASAAKAAGIRFVHLPFNIASPDPLLIDHFVAAVTAPANQPAYVHCAAGGRAAALWMIKRVLVDRWDEARALQEATELGLNDRLRPFAISYIRAHPQ
jgi:uncharacterized protein (TIGR01244 family)